MEKSGAAGRTRFGYVAGVDWRHFTSGQMRGFITAVLVSLVGAGFSAQAGLVTIARSDRAVVAAPKPQGYEADDHFPGAAEFTAIDDSQAALAGTTGTIALPDTPVPDVSGLDASIHPAAPFAFRGSAADKARAIQCLTDAVYFEAAREPDDGQKAVAQVVLNRVRHPAFPATVCGVVFQGSEKRGCQFSFACDGSMARGTESAYWNRARSVAVAAIDGSVFAPVGLATHYHTYGVSPVWNRSLVMTGNFGAHFFHRWKGWWGTPAAFSQVYRGREPFPGPHTPIDLPVVAPVQVAALQIAALPSKVAATPVAAVQPAYAQSGTPQAAYAQPALPESTILDKWKDSGKPLR